MTTAAALTLKYPTFADVLEAVAAIVRQAQSAGNAFSGTPELECRVGILSDRLEKPSMHIHRDCVDTVVAMLNNIDTWQEVTPWHESQDYFYAIDGIGDVRQTTWSDIDTFKTSTVIVQKTKIACCDIVDKSSRAQKDLNAQHHFRRSETHDRFSAPSDVHDASISAWSGAVALPRQQTAPATAHRTASPCSSAIPFCSDGSRLVLRASLALEKQISPTQVPRVITPRHVRIKQRKSFKTDKWSFDITLVWSGASKTDAELNQNTCNPTYEIELECYNKAYLQSTDCYSVAASMLLKLTDLLQMQSCTLLQSPKM